MNATPTLRLCRASGRLVVPLSGRFAGYLCRRLLPVLLTAQMQAQSIAIQDASFDARALNAGSWSTTLTPWQETNGPGNGSGFVENISGFAADGANHLGMNLNHNVWQDLGVTYQANTRYTLTVAVGNRSSNLTQSSNQSRYLLADSSSTTYATGTHNAYSLAVGTFADAPALVFETGSSSAAIGKTIRIRLEARGDDRSGEQSDGCCRHAGRHGQCQWRGHHRVVRLRDEHLLWRHGDRHARAGHGYQEHHGHGRAQRPGSGHDLSLPGDGHQQRGHDPRN
jgi:hypothetical protein